MTGVDQDGAAPKQVDDRGLRNLLMRVLTALVLIPVAIGVAYAGGWLWAALVAAISVGLFIEWRMIVGAQRTGWVALGVIYAVAALAASVVVRLDPVWGFSALMFVLLTHEFAASLLVRSTSTQVMGTRLFTLWTTGSYPQVAAMAVMMCVITAIGVLIAMAFGRGAGTLEKL